MRPAQSEAVIWRSSLQVVSRSGRTSDACTIATASSGCPARGRHVVRTRAGHPGTSRHRAAFGCRARALTVSTPRFHTIPIGTPKGLRRPRLTSATARRRSRSLGHTCTGSARAGIDQPFGRMPEWRVQSELNWSLTDCLPLMRGARKTAEAKRSPIRWYPALFG